LNNSSHTINSLLTSWLDNRFSKQAGVVSDFFKQVPKHSWNALKIGGGVGITAAAGEAGIRTANNFAHGNFNVGGPDWTTKQLGSVINSGANMVGIRPALQGAAQSLGAGIDKNPNIQKVLDATSNITNPKVRKQLLDDAIIAANQGGVAVAQNVTSSVGEELGRSVGHGLANGVWADLAKHPFLTLGGAVAFGAGPAIAYDAATYKHRKEEAERNNMIMRYMLQHTNQPKIKTAGVPGINILEYLKKLKGVSSKYLYRPSGVPVEDLNKLLINYTKQSIPSNQLHKITDFPNTLGNNPLTRHPVKGMVLPYIGLGGLATGAQAIKSSTDLYDHRYDHTVDTPLHGLKTFASESAKGPMDFVKALDVRAGKSIMPVNTITGNKLQTIASNLKGNDNPIPLPNNPKYEQPHYELSEDVLNKLRHTPIVGDHNPPETITHSIKDYLPYIGAVGLATVPFPSYLMYKKYANKKLNKITDDNEKLQNATEHANQMSNI
jgi:hypothetical protein